MAATSPRRRLARRPGFEVVLLLSAVPAAEPARCGTTWSQANGECDIDCESNRDCTLGGKCWGGMTLQCNRSLTSRCGLDWQSAGYSCNLVCHSFFAPGGCEDFFGKPCKSSSECGGAGLGCFHGLPTWPCTVTSAAQRCGSSWKKANDECGKVCINRGNCEVECYAGVDESVCETGSSTQPPVPSLPAPVIVAWTCAALASVCLLTLAVVCCKTRKASLTRAKRLQASAQGLEAQAKIMRHGSWKECWLEELRAKYLAASAERKLRRADKALAYAAVKAAGGPEFWGMTVGQLLAFEEEQLPRLKAYCADHRLASGDQRHICMRCPCPHEHGEAQFRQPDSESESLSPLPLNMHVVVALIIRPSTKDYMGIYGYATLTNLENPKKAETFISHCWNERFEDFARTMGTLRRESVVWVCSFAMPQNVDIGRLLCTDLYSSPFAKALLASERVLLVVDDDIEPLTRSWCCYEVYLAVKHRLRFELRPPQTSTDLYRKVRAKLAAMDIRQCNASNKTDHCKIMSAIHGSEDVVNTKICEIVEDTLVFLESHVP